MIVIEVILIVNILALCLYSTITDIRHSVIRNKAVLCSIAISLIANTVYYTRFASEFFRLYIGDAAVLSAIAILMYSFSFWAAGDTKMMIAIALAIPGRLLDADTLAGAAPAISIVLTSFSVAFIYVAADSIYRRIKERNSLKMDMSLGIPAFLKGYLLCSVYVLLLNATAEWLIPEIYTRNLLVFAMLDMFLAIVVSRYPIFTQKKYLYPAAAVVIVNLIYQAISNSFSLGSLRVYLYLFLVLFIRKISEEYSYRTIPTSQVQKGMVLSQRTVMMMSPSRVNGLPSVSTEDMRSRLSEEEVQSIHRWENSKYGMHTVEIVQKIPFAIFISIGTIVFLITKFGGFGL